MLTRRTFRPRLLPDRNLHEIDGSETTWEITGEEPRFLLDGELPSGFSKIVIQARGDQNGVVGVVVDRGRGLSQEDFQPICLLSQELCIKHSYIALKSSAQAVYIVFNTTKGVCQVNDFYLQRVTRLEIVIKFLLIWIQKNRYRPRNIFNGLINIWRIWRYRGLHGLWRGIISGQISNADVNYSQWLQQHTVTDEDIIRARDHIKKLKYQPLISIIMPVYNTDERWLHSAIDSVEKQIYSNWELCIADDASTAPHVRKILEGYQEKDQRVKIVWRNKNGHIAAASNSALDISSGEYVATLDHDDVLTPDALYRVVIHLNKHDVVDMIYSDEDKITEDHIRHMPYFKPDWSPDLFLSQMYTAHFAVYRRSLVAEIGKYRIGFEGAQDYDLVLRLTEKTTRIHHIPKVLYSWRQTATSTAKHSSKKLYAYKAAQRALEEAVQRRGRLAAVEPVENYPGHFRVRWQLISKPKVSIIILTRDKPDLLNQCLSSIYRKTTYKNFEVVVIDNLSKESETFKVFRYWENKEPNRFRKVRKETPFNFSALNNYGIEISKGEILLFLNNDVSVITPEWLGDMVAQAQRPEIGAVGALLLYPDQTIQHVGITLGIGGWAGHGHKGFPASTPGYAGRLLGPSNFAAVTGACLMIRRDLLLKIGMFDEKLKIACGDVELCLRALNAGKYNVVLPHVKLYHHESASRGYESTPGKVRRLEEEIAYVKKLWPGLMQKDPFYNPNLTLLREDFSLAVNE